jgi:hypothetical protein
MMKITLPKPDSIGVFASMLCMVHCLLTPFLFIAQACSSSCCASAPDWWSALDSGFLLVSFFAVMRSVKTSSNQIVKNLLWIFMITLFSIIINEKIQLFFLPDFVKYIVATSLICVHLYNSNYCQCEKENCCINNYSN